MGAAVHVQMDLLEAIASKHLLVQGDKMGRCAKMEGQLLELMGTVIAHVSIVTQDLTVNLQLALTEQTTKYARMEGHHIEIIAEFANVDAPSFTQEQTAKPVPNVFPVQITNHVLMVELLMVRKEHVLVFVQLDTLEYIVKQGHLVNLELIKKYASMVYPLATTPSAAVNAGRDTAEITAKFKTFVQSQIMV